MLSTVTIRPATIADAPALAAVHVSSSQWAYRRQLPDAYLDQLGQTLAQRVEARRTQLAQVPSEYRWWVAEQRGQVVGFASTWMSADGDAVPLTAEVLALYLAPGGVGQGVGRALL